MKKHWSKKSLRQSLLSIVTLGLFFSLALQTIPFPTVIFPEVLFTGEKYYKTTYNINGGQKICSGNRDCFGRWQGEIEIEYRDSEGNITAVERVIMKNGLRDGGSIMWRTDGSTEIIEYRMGHRVDAKKSASNNAADTTAFQVLGYSYPWLLHSLNAFGYDDQYVEAYLDTLETLLYAYEFEYVDFYDYYQEVIDSLEETVYDSIITLNSTLSFYQGLEELLNAELRLAVIDRYRSDENSTYNIVETTYPGYLLSLNDAGVTDQDFEGFCQDLDSLLTREDVLYGSLDLEDPFFVDSVDMRMFRAILSIYESGESDLKSLAPPKDTKRFYNNFDLRGMYKEFTSVFSTYVLNSTPAEVSEVVQFLMILQFDQGDIIKQAVLKAYLINNGVMRFPSVATEFSTHNSATSVTLNGYVLEDGGGDVTARGIAWATFYNPTSDDNTASSGSGIGNFTVTLDALTEGTTYYARTYATNSAGTAYGNCIMFTATSTAGTSENEILSRDFKVYPNPASGIATFSFHVGASESLVLTIVDLKGQVVYRRGFGSLPAGENHVELDLSGIQDGMYICVLTSNGTTKVTRKLIIRHQ